MSFLHDWQPELRLEPSWFLVRIFSWIALSGVCLLLYASWYQIWFLCLLMPWFAQLKYQFWPSIRLQHARSVQALCLKQGRWQLELRDGAIIQASLQKAFSAYGIIILTFKPLAFFWARPIRVMVLSDQLDDEQLRLLRTCLRFRRKDFFTGQKQNPEF